MRDASNATLLLAATALGIAAALLLERRRRRRHRRPPIALDARYRHCELSTSEIKAKLPHGVALADLELHPSTSRTAHYDIARAKRIFDMYGCVVVRGLNRQYVDEIRAHADATFD